MEVNEGESDEQAVAPPDRQVGAAGPEADPTDPGRTDADDAARVGGDDAAVGDDADDDAAVGDDADDDAAVGDDAGSTPGSPVRRAAAWCRSNPVTAVAAGILLASVVAAASVYWWLYRPDRLTDAAAQQNVVAAARQGTEALLSYSPDRIDADLANAKSHLTGDFLSYYTDFTEKVVAPASREKGVKTEANVARAAVSQMRPGQADVLVFVNQVTTSTERPTPALSTSSVLVTLVESGGKWLISGFNPV